MNTAAPTPRFTKADARLRRDLDSAAADWLAATGDHRLADRGMILKMLVLIVAGTGAYALALGCSSALTFFLSYFVFMLMAMLLAINVVHDASHNAFLRSARANRLLNRAICLPLGMDPECWRVRHVLFHHPNVNIQGLDLDIEENGVLRQTPHQRWRPFMRWQRFYWPLVAGMTFPWIIWVFDWQDRAGFTPVGRRMATQGWRGWTAFLCAKVVHLLLAIGLPWVACGAQLGIGFILATYLLAEIGASLIFVMLILGTHWAKGRFFTAADEDAFAHGRWAHQYATTFDWQTRPGWIGYWLGGMNMHLTHHLFPDWSHRHYSALGTLVRAVGQRHGMVLPAAGLGEFVRWQQGFLAHLGDRPAQEAPPETSSVTSVPDGPPRS